MPWILWRHLTFATLVPFALLLVSLTAVLLLLLSARIGDLAPMAAFGLGDLLPLFSYALPHLTLLTIPVTFLAGVLLAYGHLSAEGGYVACRVAGLGPLRLAAPALALGMALTAAGLGLTLVGEPWGNTLLRREVVQLAKLGAAGGLRPGAFNEALRGLTLYVGRTEGDGRMSDFLLFDRRDPERTVAAFARSGRVDADRDRDRLLIELEAGELHNLSPDGRVFRRGTFERYRFDVDLHELLEKRVSFFGAFEGFDLGGLERAIESVRALGHPTWRYELAYHRKLSLPFAALAFALLGVGLGLGRMRSPRLRAAIVAVALVAAYYVLLRAGDGFAARGDLPIIAAAWLPNLVLFPIGIALLLLRMRERS